MENLWPVFKKAEITTPRSVFEKQVEFFNTLDIGLRASLSQGMGVDGNFSYTFRLQATALSGYTFTLFKASHNPGFLYPIIIEDFRGNHYEPRNQNDLEITLKEIFNQPQLREMIQNLIAQIYDNASGW